MRSLLVATLALFSTLHTLVLPVADACGGYVEQGPAVYALDQLRTMGPGNGLLRKTVVLWSSGVGDEDHAWRPVTPGDFEPKEIAPAPALPSAVTMTLVGPGGAQVVTSKRQLLLRTGRAEQKTWSTIELGATKALDFRVAIVGSYPTATWTGLEPAEVTGGDRTWAKNGGFEPTSVFASRVTGTYIRIVTAMHANGVDSMSRVNPAVVGRSTTYGAPVGMISLGEQRFVLLDRAGVITSVEI